MKVLNGFLLSALLLIAWRPGPAHATAGLAEWDVLTPGTNQVCHTDPFIETHGTCLRPSDKRPAVGPANFVYVSHVEWWQYFPGYVVGKAAKGFFVFNEKSRAVGYHETEEALNARLVELKLTTPLTRRLTDQDGWRIAWGPLLVQQAEQFKQTAPYKQMSEEQKQALEKQLEEFKNLDLRPAPAAGTAVPPSAPDAPAGAPK